MITKTIYKCEKCGQEYEVEQLAHDCELSHMDADFIISESFNKTEIYPNEIVVTMSNGHRLKYTFSKPIYEEIPDEPNFTGVNVSRHSVTNNVVLSAVGNRLPDPAFYTWVILCDDNRISATSESPTVILDELASEVFDESSVVRVKVSTPTVPSAQFVVKK